MQARVFPPHCFAEGFWYPVFGAMKWEAVGLPDGVTFECPEFMASDPEVLVLFHNQKKMGAKLLD